ncbi:MAG: DedA family protein [Gammaproteobacteria bacterium]|nr:DedA family protein [Gammaproteobacteria bacterium]
MLETFLTHLQGPLLSLWGPFFILVLCGLGLPIPEDLVLLVAGAMAALEGRAWSDVSILMYIAVIGGDTLIFMGGRRLGGRLLESALTQQFFPPAKRLRVEQFYARHGAKGLFLARFLPGLRGLIFFSAGSLGVPLSTFLLLDGLAALLSVPVFVGLGYWLWARYGHDLAQFSAVLDQVHDWSLGLVAMAVLVVLCLVWRRVRAGP